MDGFVRIYKVVLPALNALKSIFHPIAFEISLAILKFKSDLLYNSCFYFTILELKQRLQIGVGFDIMLDLPQLDLLYETNSWGRGRFQGYHTGSENTYTPDSQSVSDV